MAKKNLIKCDFTSIWDDGSEVTTPCTFDPSNGSVDPKVSKGKIPDGCLIREFITLPNGDEKEVCSVCHSFILKTNTPDLEECFDPDCSDEY